MAGQVLTCVHSLHKRLDGTVSAQRNEILIESHDKGILKSHQIEVEIEAFSKAVQHKLYNGAFGELLKSAQETIILPPHGLLLRCNGNFVLELDFEPFNASFPRPNLSKSIGYGVEFLNRHLSAKMFHDKESMHPLLDFLEVHNYKDNDVE
ncbi:sucrose synthase 4 [Actinidia rufa]|uniref:sucrose synthase n=1 Tax=Actinidia rufa TaxID=165716 RepID=A0A7J0E965_9ERIC|nr:sucrose synthase 4 [Actinidia rufa]